MSVVLNISPNPGIIGKRHIAIEINWISVTPILLTWVLKVPVAYSSHVPTKKLIFLKNR